MPSPAANPTPITPPRVPLIDERTGLIDRAWYMFFLNLYRAAVVVIDDTGLGPNAESLIASYDAALRALAQETETQPPQVDCCVEIDKIKQDNALTPPSEVGELQQQIDTVRQELQVRPIPALGSMAALQQDNVPWLTFAQAPDVTPTAVGTVAWDGGTTLGVQATANVLIRVGEAEYVYVKASSAVTKGQVVYHTGSVGASGVITVAPTPLALTDPNQIVGIAAETIALNGFGLIQVSGTLRGFNTTGSSVSETWADGDALYYNPAYVGSMTKVKPSAPNQKTYLGEVISAATAGSGSMSIRITPGSILGGTDSNVQFGTLNNGDLIQYDSVAQYWKNVPSSTFGTGTVTSVGLSLPTQFAISGSPVTTAGTLTAAWNNQTANYVLAAPNGSAGAPTFRALVSGDIPALSYVSSVGATAPITSTGGLTPTIGVTAAALTKTNDTNVTMTLGGSASTALLNAASITLGWTGQLAVSRGGTGVSTTPTNGQLLIGNGTGYTVANLTAGSGVSITNSAGGISISATGTGGTVTSVGLSMPTQFAVTNSPVTGSGTLTAAWNNQTANYVLAGPTTGAAAAPTFRALVSGDIPALSYVSSVSATAPITSTGGLTPTIGVTSAALTKTNDTNVTMTLGGSPTTALLAATSLTLGWTGQLAVSRGGTGLSSGTSGGIPYFSSTSAMTSSAALTQYGVVYGGGAGAAPAATAAGTTGQVLTATTGGAPTWSSTYAGTVTSVSVVSANGFAGTVATATTTPAITISTSITGLLYGNGTAIAAATVSAPLTYSAGTLAITQAGASSNGYLSSTDWNTFNNKQPAGAYVTSVTGTSPVVSSGGTTPAISLASGYGDTQNPYASKTANYVLAAPNGSAGVPTFRALVAADIPSLPYQPTQAPVTYTANFSVATTNVWIINNKSGSSCTATLPTASSYTGRVLYFQNYQAQTLVSASSNVVPLAGGAAGTAILAAVAGDTATLVSDGTNWIMTQYVPNNVLLLE